MKPEEIRVGMKVSIKENLVKTNRKWGDPGYYPYGDDRGVLVDHVHFSTPRNSENQEYVVEANGSYFDPDDLEYYEPKDSPEEVQLIKGKILKFNPESL